MKKFLIIGLIVALVTFFTLPALAFAEEVTSDTYTYTGTDDGQMTMDIEGDGDEEPDTDVLCIDPCIDPNDNDDAYTDTGAYVSEVLQIDGIDEVNAEAVEILATTASGGTAEENQEAVKDIIKDDLDATPDENSEVIENAVMDLAEIFANLPENNDADPSNDVTLQEFMDAQNVNELKITLDPDPLVDPVTLETNDKFVATAIMENPLVPTITDEAKVTSWYILAGSYNVSFSETDLITETTSIMSDVVDDADATPSEDNDGDGTTDDNYGLATVPYFFYWWGVGYPQYEEMNVDLFAWVDIDEDTKLDITDLPGDAGLNPGDPGYIDGDVVGNFMKDYQVVKTQEDPGNPGQHIVIDTGTTTPEGIPIAETEPVLNTEAIEFVETVVCTHGHWHPWDTKDGGTLMYWDCDGNNHDGYYNAPKDLCDNPTKTEEVKVNQFDICERVGGIVLNGEPNEKRVDNPRPSCDNGYWGTNSWHCNGHDCAAEGLPRYTTTQHAPYCSHTGAHWNTNSWDCWCGQDGKPRYIQTQNPDPSCNHGGWGTNSWHCDGHKCSADGLPRYGYVDVPSQRFVIENYSEPFAEAEKLYEAWGSLDLTKTDSVSGALVPGATYQLAYVDGPSMGLLPIQLVTDANGEINFSGLPWGIYELTEILAPAGYNIDGTVYTFYIGGNALFEKEGIDNVLSAIAPVQDVPIPAIITGGGGVPPVLTVAGLTTAVEVAGISEETGSITVAGIQELPFTGSNLIFMLIGILMAVSGLAVCLYLRKSTAK